MVRSRADRAGDGQGRVGVVEFEFEFEFEFEVEFEIEFEFEFEIEFELAREGVKARRSSGFCRVAEGSR